MQTSMQTMDMEISGLGSEPAGHSVCSALNCIRGVVQVAMEPNRRYVTVTYDAFKVSPHQFVTAVSVMGCQVERMAIRDVHAAAADYGQDAAVRAGISDRSPFRLA